MGIFRSVLAFSDHSYLTKYEKIQNTNCNITGNLFSSVLFTLKRLATRIIKRVFNSKTSKTAEQVGLNNSEFQFSSL